MQRVFILLIIATTLALAGCQPQVPAATHSTAAPTVAVSASASVAAVPDRLQLSLSVERLGQDIPALKTEVDKITANLLSYLREQGISDTAIQSFAIRITPQYRYDDGQQHLTGYQVSRRMVIDFHDPEQHSPFLEYALNNGVQRVSEPQLTISNADELYQQALTQALELARTKAEQLALTAGVTIMGVQDIRESSNQAPVTRYRVPAAEMQADVSLPGQQAVEARIEVVYRLSQAL
ncbi:SIMPL domain-containing protein [Pseudidiomarina terrestris]|uniref:SIMPL domain-containing protein n=1 Tax=Pseudidiomarina terrestris TaxID=2820060 RepID=A0ABT8MK89_9GAMM|nr:MULTISPECIES: SIMPL domain-containing protein [unclassified Pseudidiomarina]MDN7130366.1 SIMPL domain-containing protein [Pseudidiomarina sp. 1APR75-15]MDN7136289.1 SIMPL domain-containing protein [Pseudidiomarina sp. 1ASP75-5]MDN7138794.1 SIMPL domain-containing protein [Pseudidiomarina sp. 1ASP75-14]